MCQPEIKEELTKAASKLKDNDILVEVGVWLGACTAAGVFRYV